MCRLGSAGVSSVEYFSLLRQDSRTSDRETFCQDKTKWPASGWLIQIAKISSYPPKLRSSGTLNSIPRDPRTGISHEIRQATSRPLRRKHARKEKFLAGEGVKPNVVAYKFVWRDLWNSFSFIYGTCCNERHGPMKVVVKWEWQTIFDWRLSLQDHDVLTGREYSRDVQEVCRRTYHARVGLPYQW